MEEGDGLMGGRRLNFTNMSIPRGCAAREHQLAIMSMKNPRSLGQDVKDFAFPDFAKDQHARNHLIITHLLKVFFTLTNNP